MKILKYMTLRLRKKYIIRILQVTSMAIVSVIENLPMQQSPALEVFTKNSYNCFKEIQCQFFNNQKMKRNAIQNSACVLHDSKDKDTT